MFHNNLFSISPTCMTLNEFWTFGNNASPVPGTYTNMSFVELSNIVKVSMRLEICRETVTWNFDKRSNVCMPYYRIKSRTLSQTGLSSAYSKSKKKCLPEYIVQCLPLGSCLVVQHHPGAEVEFGQLAYHAYCCRSLALLCLLWYFVGVRDSCWVPLDSSLAVVYLSWYAVRP